MIIKINKLFERLSRFFRFFISDNYKLNNKYQNKNQITNAELILNVLKTRGFNPKYIIDESGQIPVPDEQYEYVLSLNTLEHIYDIYFALKEIYRVLKPNGEIVFTVPFIFRTHGHPNDYFRGAASWWNKTLNQIGFDSIAIELFSRQIFFIHSKGGNSFILL